MDTVDGLRDTARRARECAVMGQAVTLARWIGNGRCPVTAGRVLRKANVPAAGAALEVDVPARLRTMADIRALHRPWCAAIATGLLQVGGGAVTADPALALLAGFGAVAGDPRRPAITSLGPWAAGHLAAGLAGRLALQYCLPDGKTVVDRFVASRRACPPAVLGKGANADWHSRPAR